MSVITGLSFSHGLPSRHCKPLCSVVSSVVFCGEWCGVAVVWCGVAVVWCGVAVVLL